MSIGETLTYHLITVPAAIISFGRTMAVLRKGRTQLACLTVGVPSPERTWLGPNNTPVGGDRFKIHTDGSLLISDVHKSDEGNYTCSVRNEEGTDQIQYSLHVQGKFSCKQRDCN
jgi:hypothetical protein